MGKATYDKYYKKADYFGQPMTALTAFFDARKGRGVVYDLGCGQGRDALALAKMGYRVVGVDISAVGISQLNDAAKAQGLGAVGTVGDAHAMDVPQDADIVLLDAMLHFYKRDVQKETDWAARILSQMRPGALFVSAMIAGKQREALLKSIADADAAVWRVVHDGYGEYKHSRYHIWAIDKQG